LLFRSHQLAGKDLQLAGKTGFCNWPARQVLPSIAVSVVLFFSVAKGPRCDARSPIGPCKITKDL
jgi:hypothetical protein